MTANIYLGDCFEAMKKMGEGSYQLAIPDPPYNIASKQKRGVGSRLDKTGKMNEWNGTVPDKMFFDNLFRVSDKQVIWGANNFTGLPATEYFCIWNKKQTVPNFASAEYAWVSPSCKMPAKVFDYGIHQHNQDIDRMHPTQKPVSLYKWLLKTYGALGDKILDPFGGSMSSVLACIDLGFDIDIWEKDPDYFASAKLRIQNYCQQLPIFGEPPVINFYE